jgi:hypothetical protein
MDTEKSKDHATTPSREELDAMQRREQQQRQKAVDERDAALEQLDRDKHR